MIFDRLENASLYGGVHEKFEAAFAFLSRAVREELPVGRYELDGERLFAMVQEYDTDPTRENRFEGHLKYIDIQFVVSGEEAFETVDASVAKADTDYSEEKDVRFYANGKADVCGVLSEGTYAVFFPNDVHKPGLAVRGLASHVKKVVVKVRV